MEYIRCRCADCLRLDTEDRPYIGSLHARLFHGAGQAQGILQDYIRENRRSRATTGNTYFCTVTTPPGYKEYQKWLVAISKILKRKFVLSFTIVAEHIETNLHAHILINANKQVQKKDFHSYCKATGASIIDVKKVTEDNGIEDYLQLENPSFTTFHEFANFILEYTNGIS